MRRAGLGAILGAVLLAAPLAWGATTTSRAVSASGQLQQTAKPARFSTVQKGTIRGAPFGSGQMVLRSTLRQARVTSTFTLDTAAGRVSGSANARLTLDGDTATYRGTATVTGGTRRYRRIARSTLTFSGVGPIDAESTKISLSGRVRY